MKRRIPIHTLTGAEITIKKEIECNVSKFKAAKAYNLMDKIFRFRELDKEYSYIIALDQKYYPISILESPPGKEHSVGIDYVGAAYYTRAVGAKYIIKAHNHPGGNPTPSVADVDCFVGFYTIFGDQLLDYMVFGSDAIASPFAQKYFSFYEEEYFYHPHNIYIHHLERVTVSLFRDTCDLWVENNKIRKEIKKIKTSIKELETTANSGL